MKFDKFLAMLFSKKAVAVLLLVVLSVFCLTACRLTCEDIFCLTFFGCLSFDTCREMIWACDCDCDDDIGGGGSSDSNESSNCVADSYNGCFGCIWDGGLKDCRPSTVCNSCDGSEEDEEYAPDSCDDCMIDCIDGCVN